MALQNPPNTGSPTPQSGDTTGTTNAPTQTAGVGSAGEQGAGGGSGNSGTGQGLLSTSNFTLTTGWYVAATVVTSILVSGTKVAPLALGFMGIALIYQLQLMLQGK